MWRQLVFKSTRALLTFLVVVLIVFSALRLSGDPAYAILPPDTPPEVVSSHRVMWGLDRPLPEQFLRYVAGVFSGEFGKSMLDGQDVRVLIADRLPRTILLMTTGLAIGVISGVLLGIAGALRQGSTFDRLIMAFAVSGYALPSFFLGLLFILLFSVRLGILPSGGNGSIRHLVLPTLTIAVANAGLFARFSRASMLDELPRPYIRAALARGLPFWKIVARQAIPNAALPVITILGLSMGSLIGGAVITETVFAWHGVGDLLVTSVARRDLAVVQAIVLLIAATMVASNLIVDVGYQFLDPRMRTRIGRVRT